MNPNFNFDILTVDANSQARRGAFHTPHGVVQTPAFMPIGTVGSVKGIEISQLEATGSQMILGNTYHLSLRPGEEIVAKLGGLHKFCGWNGPILTDSGGFQIFSLAQLLKIKEEGAYFRSHIDGRALTLTPERSVQIQEALGSDVAMVLDHVVGLPNTDKVIRDAFERTIRWAKRCRDAHTREDQAQFGIVQGGLSREMRVESAQALAEIGFEGYAIGGLSVGEPPEDMYRTIDFTEPAMPKDRPRYLMGVGTPRDLIESIHRGVDLFDCVMPTRNGRNAFAFTDCGPMRMRNAQYIEDPRPIDETCPCPACKRSRAYIRHLFAAGEMLGPILLSIHNITYYQRLVSRARDAIVNGTWKEFRKERLAGWGVEPFNA